MHVNLAVMAVWRKSSNEMVLVEITVILQSDPQSRLPPLAMLDSTSAYFRSQLAALDCLPTRFCNTVFVLYCREGHTQAADILACQVRLPVLCTFALVECISVLGYAERQAS